MATRAVSIAELKNKLSAYLAEVRRGEEFVVNDRKLPIARLRGQPRDRWFVCFDRKLRAAADVAGFTVLPVEGR